MDTQNTKTLAPVIHKNVRLIQAKNNIPLLGRKLFNVLIYDVFMNGFSDVEKLESYIPLSELRVLLNQTDKHYDKIKKNLEVLQGTIFQTDLSSDEEIDITSISLLPKWKIKHNNLIYRFDEELVELILQPSIYKTLQLNIMNDFSSKYALALYENIKRYENVGSTGFKEVVFWKNVICGENTYQDFRHFHRQVIQKAVQEINNFSDINVDYEFKKKDRKVIEIKFTCEKQERKLKTRMNEKQNSLVLPQKMSFKECIQKLVDGGKLSPKLLDSINKNKIE